MAPRSSSSSSAWCYGAALFPLHGLMIMMIMIVMIIIIIIIAIIIIVIILIILVIINIMWFATAILCHVVPFTAVTTNVESMLHVEVQYKILWIKTAVVYGDADEDSALSLASDGTIDSAVLFAAHLRSVTGRIVCSRRLGFLRSRALDSYRSSLTYVSGSHWCGLPVVGHLSRGPSNN
jgi:hypothetical protein